MKVVKQVVKIILYGVVIGIGLELSMWALGFRPYQNQDYKIDASPNNPFTGHDSLGFELSPGSYTITLNDGLTFTANHLLSGVRKTSFQPDSDYKTAHIFGCSFTYGYGVDDEQTFCSRLQQQVPSHKVINYGVMGYGTVQSYLQLQNVALDSSDHVILCFSPQHLMRNTLSPMYRAHLKIGFDNSSSQLEKNMEGAQFPYLSDCEKSIKFEPWNELYSNFLGREYSVLVNHLQTTYDYYTENTDEQIESSTYLIEQMNEICRRKGTQFTVACLDSSLETERIREGLKHLNWVNLNFDFTDTSLTNYPYDSHPNEIGNLFIANQLKTSLFDEKN